jgi:hypothetical protein
MKTKNLLHAASVTLALTLFFSTHSFGQGTWTQKADFPGEGRYRAACFSIGTKGYIGAAVLDSDFPYNDLWEWDQTTNLWTRKADYPGKSADYVASLSIGSKGYIGFGLDNPSSSRVNEFWEFDPVANTWTQKASIPIETIAVGFNTFSIGNKGYFESILGFWEWDQETNVWTKKSDYPGKASDVSFSIGNKGYVGLGYDYVAKNYTNEFWEWDQETDIWTRKTGFGGISRIEVFGFSIGNKGYIGTGLSDLYTSNNTYNDLWEWDQTTDVWTKKADFGGATRRSANGFSIGNKGYIGLGTTGTTDKFYQDFWEYDPSLTTGFAELAKDLSSIFPNPASDNIIVNFNNRNNSQVEVNIYNITGELVRSEILKQYHQQISVADLRNGLYVVEIKSEEGLAKQKLIIKR